MSDHSHPELEDRITAEIASMHTEIVTLRSRRGRDSVGDPVPQQILARLPEPGDQRCTAEYQRRGGPGMAPKPAPSDGPPSSRAAPWPPTGDTYAEAKCRTPSVGQPTPNTQGSTDDVPVTDVAGWRNSKPRLASGSMRSSRRLTPWRPLAGFLSHGGRRLKAEIVESMERQWPFSGPAIASSAAGVGVGCECQTDPYGTWQTRWRDIDGRQRARTFRTRALAEKHERKVRTDTDRGLPTAPGRRLSTAAWATAWLQGAHNLEPSSQRIYREAWAHLEPELGRLPLHKLNAGHIDRALAGYAATGAAPSSVSRAFRTLRTMLNAAVDRDLIVKSPMRGVKAPGYHAKRCGSCQPPSSSGWLRRSTPATGRLILVAGWGGLRWGELAGLRMGDVDHDAGRVHVTGQLSTDGRRWKPETKTKGPGPSTSPPR